MAAADDRNVLAIKIPPLPAKRPPPARERVGDRAQNRAPTPTPPPMRVAPAPASAAGNPLGAVPEDALDDFVDSSLFEE